MYPGSFDPLTNGHVDIIERGTHLFDKIIVAILVNTDKSPLFSKSERVEIVREVFKGRPNVEVDTFDGLLVDYLTRRKADVIVRGLRALSDFEAEFHFRITGGKTYRSVGLSFDVEGVHETLVYLSAYNAGPKVQIAYKNGADYTYPAEATQARQVPLDQTQQLIVRVRGSLVNVSVNGVHALAYKLPLGRKTGRVELITYDAEATFEKMRRGFAKVAVRTMVGDELADEGVILAIFQPKAKP